MFVIAGYIIANRPIGTPSEMRFGTDASNVPAAIALIESIGGVSAKSETDSRFPMAMPITMLNRTKNGRSRKSSSFASRRAVIGSRGRVHRSRSGGLTRLRCEGLFGVVLAPVLRDRVAVERGDQVVLAQADEAEAAMADGGRRKALAGAFVADHLDTFVIGWERLITR